MLKKVFKYDFLAIWRIWWMAALGAFVSGIMGEFLVLSCSRTENPFGSALEGFSGGMLLVFSVSIFLILILILLCVRFYRNFYTDEGYLTFTLPVSRSTHLASKILCGMLYSFLSAAVLLLEFGVFLLLLDAFGSAGFAAVVWENLDAFWKGLSSFLSGGEIGIFLTEGLLLLIAAVCEKICYFYLCITAGAVAAKKHKILAAIGIYYGSSFLIGLFRQFMSLVGLPVLAGISEDRLSGLLDSVWPVAVIGLIVIAWTAAVAAVLWLVNDALLRKKLNLD